MPSIVCWSHCELYLRVSVPLQGGIGNDLRWVPIDMTDDGPVVWINWSGRPARFAVGEGGLRLLA